MAFAAAFPEAADRESAECRSVPLLGPIAPDRPKAVELFQRLGRFQIGIACIDLQLIASSFVDPGLIFFH